MRKSDDFRKIRSFSGGVKPFIDGIFNAIKITFTSITLIMAVVVSGLAMMVWIHLAKVPNLSMLESYNPGASLQLFDIEDKLICTYPSKEKRKPISLNNVSPYMINAVLAAEDHAFYHHQGISFAGILRAAIANISAGKTVQGGSTLTQQLVKNIFYKDDDRTIQLKIAEGIVASEIERKYKKEKILEIYLNQIYFGNGAYGIEKAAQTYFGKTADQLNAAESAFLAGIIKSPSYLGDPKNFNKAIARQKRVLAQMEENKFISQLEAEVAKERQLLFNVDQAGQYRKSARESKQFVPPYPYFCQYIAESISNDYNYTHNKGLKIYTTLDIKAQKAAEAVIDKAASRLPKALDQAALVSIRLSDGAVLAMVGGTGGYLEHQWNSAVHPHTMGSSFKPFVYLAAFEHGVISPSSQLYDSPLSVMDEGDTIWQPQNFDHRFLGYMTAEDALAQSRNICSVRVAQQIGIERVIDAARRAGIKEDLAPTLALSLGSSAASPLSMANAYATIARGGRYIRPRFIRRVENERGKVLEEFEPLASRSLDLTASKQIIDILRKVVESGTGTRARIPGLQIAGKTGTADQSKDLWFVGFTADMVAAVWVGNSENKPVGGKHTTGGRVVAPIWKRYTQAYYKSHRKPTQKLLSNGGPSTTSPIKEAVPLPQTTYQNPYYRKRKPSKRKQQRRAPASAKPGTGITEYSWH